MWKLSAYILPPAVEQQEQGHPAPLYDVRGPQTPQWMQRIYMKNTQIVEDGKGDVWIVLTDESGQCTWTDPALQVSPEEECWIRWFAKPCTSETFPYSSQPA